MDPKKKNILVVDDEDLILKVFKIILEQKGYNVDTAETGKEALKKINSKKYDLALLDQMLPDMNGTELLAKIHRSTPRMIKIMVTGHSNPKIATRSLELGATEYLIKPVNPEKLLTVVKMRLEDNDEIKNINNKRAQSEIRRS